MSLEDVQKITGGVLLGANVSFNSVSIDSRTLQKDDLFIAISGPNFNGNNFVKAAANQKAAAAIVTENVEVDLPMLNVSDGRIALGQIGALNREKSNACVIALTGSQGKTTVKEMIAEILQSCGDVVCTKGNLNNDYGVPLSLLQINQEHDFAVIELGASGPGEIAYSVELTKPRLAHITNVEATHLEGFGSIDGVARAKAELWTGIEAGGVAVINIDDDYAQQWCEQASHNRIVTISAKGLKRADYYVIDSVNNHDLSSDFNLQTPNGSLSIHLNLAGQHNIANALAAAALSMESGASLINVQEGLQRMQAIAGRFCSKTGVNQSRIIDDSYNASPSSFKAAINVLSNLPGTKIIAMGDMGELGIESEQAHADIGRYAKECEIDYLFTIGELSSYAEESFSNRAEKELSIQSLAERIVPLLDKNVTVLVKGSRSAGMDKLVQLLLDREG